MAGGHWGVAECDRCPPPRQRYRRMRRTLIKFRSLVHIYVNRRRYLKVRWGLAHPGGGPGTPSHPAAHSVVDLERAQQHPQTLSPIPTTSSVPHGAWAVPLWGESLVMLGGGGNGTPGAPCCLWVSLPPGGGSARLLCLQRKEDARRRAEEEKARMKQVPGCRRVVLGRGRRVSCMCNPCRCALVPTICSPTPTLLSGAPMGAGVGSSVASGCIPVLRRQELTRREVVDVTHLEIPAELMGLLEAAAGERVPRRCQHHSLPLVPIPAAVP